MGGEDEANTIAAGVKVWVTDPDEAYVTADVLAVDGDRVKIAVAAGAKPGEREVKPGDLNLVENETLVATIRHMEAYIAGDATL